MWSITLFLCLLFAFSVAGFPNLFDNGRVDAISFRFADRDINGKVNLNEFKSELLKYDMNYDSKLSQGELSNCIIPWSTFKSSGDVSNFQPAFNTLDENNDGNLSFDEARKPASQ